MKTYLLKSTIHNAEMFPIGTVVKLINEESFEVVSGNLKGQVGIVIDYLHECLVDDTESNRKLLSDFIEAKNKFESQWLALTPSDL